MQCVKVNACLYICMCNYFRQMVSSFAVSSDRLILGSAFNGNLTMLEDALGFTRVHVEGD